MSNCINLNSHMREIKKQVMQLTNYLFGNVNVLNIGILLENDVKYDQVYSQTRITVDIEVRGYEPNTSIKNKFVFIDLDDTCFNVKNNHMSYSDELIRKNNNTLIKLLNFIKEYIPKSEYERILNLKEL